MNERVLVDVSWLSANLNAPNVLVVDVRPPPFYAQGHIPNAVNLPVFLITEAGGFPVAPKSLAARMGAVGIARDLHVIAYDDGSSPQAATFFRILSYYGHPRVSVLDGGVTLWAREGHEIEYLAEKPQPTQYSLGDPDSSSILATDGVNAVIGAQDVAILDVRSPAEYLGLQISADRDGHIPGAINLEWSDNLTRDTDGVYRFRDADELRHLYREAGATPDKRVIVYCQSGNRVSETFMALKHLGYPNVASYLPGWQEWGNRSDLPVEAE